MATGVITLLLALSQGNREWNSQYIVWLFVIAAVSLVLFVLIELWVGDPLVDLRLYRNATYSMATLVGVLLGFAMYGSSLLLPLFLEDFLEYTALQAAIIMLPGVVLTGVISPLVGNGATSIIPASSWCWAFSWRRRPPIGLPTWGANREGRWSGRCSCAVDSGLSSRPSSCWGCARWRARISAASGLVNITRQIAGMGGIALAGVLLERWHYVHHLTGAEHLATSTVGVEQVQRTLAGILQEGGDLGELLHTKVQAALSHYLTQESLVVAFQDCNVVFTVVFVAAALASVCIPGGEEKQ